MNEVSGRKPAQQVEPEDDLGHRLEGLLDHLARSGLKVGPRERVAVAALVASLTASRAVRTLGDLAPMLAPLLARSPDERRAFHQVLAAYAPETARAPVPDEATPTPGPTPTSRWWVPVAGLVAIAAVVSAAFMFWPAPPEDVKRAPQSYDLGGGAVTPAPQIEKAAEAAPTDNELLDRIGKAAERFEGAPTLDELSSPLARTTRIAGWPAESYAVRLQELTGLPRDRPLALYAGNGIVLARLAHALDRLERPGREPPLSVLATAAAKLLAERKPGPVYEIAAGLPQWLAGEVPQEKAALIALVKRRAHAARTGRDEQPPAIDAVDEFTVQRALAITADDKARRIYEDAPWLAPAGPTGGAAPWWIRLLATLAQLVLAVLWLANSLALRKAYLRRRPPALPPLHVDLVAEAATRVTYPAGLFRRIAQRLQKRTSRPTTQIDAAATIAATVRGGGEIVVPVVAATRHAPEYLVLIERRASGDQDAARLRDLVRRLDILVPIAIYYFQGEPSILEPEKSGRPVPIERLQAQFADHRLLILGAGSELLDPATLKPHASAAKLRHWPERALLTPLGIAEWGQEEFALASELDMPVGRATPEGLLALAEAIGRDGEEREDLLVSRGDGLARPLPEVLRVRPQRFLYSTPPGDLPVPLIVQQLRNFLDGPGFEWLAGLAIYPAVQWDLTLYLGVSLPEQSGGAASGARLYREDRIAALTQLPWLREGHMPDWLRRALIETLTPARSGEIRAALQQLIQAAELTGNRAHDEAVKLRIAQEPAKDRVAPSELLEDEVLLDFLARGRIEDFALPRSNLLDAILPRGLLDRIGIPELSAGVVAAIYAIAAWWLAPSPADGALLTGAWLPLLVLALGGLFALAIAEPRTTYQALYRRLVALGPIALAFALLAPLIADGGMLASIQASFAATLPGLGELVAVLVALAAVALGRRVGNPLLRIASPMRRAGSARLVRSVVVALALLIVTYIAVATLSTATAPSQQPFDWRFAAAGMAAFTLLFLMVRLLPPRLPPPRAAPRRGRRLWTMSGAAFKAAMALLPILPAVWLGHLVAGSSQLLQPMPGGVTAIAETADGSRLALGGVDGRVRVYTRKDGRLEAVPRIVEPKVATGAVTSLALRFEADDAQKPLILAVGSADGAVRSYDGEGGSERPLPKAFEAARSIAAPPLVALMPGGVMAAAIEGADGNGLLITASGSLPLADSGPVSAMAAVGPGALAVATLDGRVWLVTVDAAYGPRIARDDDASPRLPGRARKLLFDAPTQRLTAIGDDGAVLTARVEGGALIKMALAETKLAAMSLGPAVAFRGNAAPVGRVERVALVIGNSRYSVLPALMTPGQDARAIGLSLRALGFDVETLLDAGKLDLEAKLAAFKLRAAGAVVALVYFSGHSASVDDNNLLAASDSDLTSGDTAAVASGVAIETLLDAVAPARELKVVLLDTREQREIGGPQQIEQQVAQKAKSPKKASPRRRAELPADSIIGYAAGDGTQALDLLEGQQTSPYATALLRALARPDRSVRELFRDVRDRVIETTNGRQRPVIVTNVDDQQITILGSRASAEVAQFSTVRVFYGTDRAVAQAPSTGQGGQAPEQRAVSPGATKSLKPPSAPASSTERLRFDSLRARRLALGSVEVSAPLDRSVSQIERPWQIKIPYLDVKLYEEPEDPRKHFTVRKIDQLPLDAFTERARNQAASSARFGGQALVLIHGFNTSFENAIYRAAQIAVDMKFDGPVFVYSWPSAGGIGSYIYDRDSAAQAEPYLRQFLEQVVRVAGPGRVNVIAHGMGVQPLLSVLRDLQRSAKGAGAPLNQLILAAPDVDRDAFESAMTSLALSGIAKGTTVYVSANDRMLDASRRFNGAVPRAGDVPPTGPLVLPGVDTIDVTGVSTDSLGLNHSSYAERKTLLHDIGMLIETGERPPEKRVPILQKVESPKGTYWRYPNVE